MKVLGKNVNVFILMNDSPAVFVPFGCARNCVFTSNTVIAPCSTVGSGTASEFIGLSTNWNVSVSGLCTFDENAEIPDVRTIQKSLVKVFVSFIQTAGARTVAYSGYGILETITESASYTDVETFDIQIQGSGEYSIEANAAYGNYPPLFQIIDDTPSGGNTLLDFVWNAADPVPDTYTIRITNLDTLEVTYEENIPEIGHTASITVERIYNYSFAIQSVYSGVLRSAFSPEITRDADAFIMIDSNLAEMIDSNGAIMANPE